MKLKGQSNPVENLSWNTVTENGTETTNKSINGNLKVGWLKKDINRKQIYDLMSM